MTQLFRAGANTFITQLKPHELSLLRQVVRRVIWREGQELIDDVQVDMYIESVGPETAEKMLKRAVDAGWK